MKPAILIVSYNRPRSLKRLLNAISSATYSLSEITLVISIDFQNSIEHSQVVELAKEFVWKFGEKRIIEHKENLGLRNHVIRCGSLSKQYGSIIMLEDDILVSPNYYNYCLQMLSFYENKDFVAGISLYKHLRNVNINRPFCPENNGKDVFLMQFAQSWGQCWSFRMWDGFYSWYLENKYLAKNNIIPDFVSGWPESSWLKYFIKYVIDTNKYFIYPYESLSTNFGDSGTHNKLSNNISQVPIQLHPKTYTTPEYDDLIRYDAFFEREGLDKYLQLDDVCIDLYSTKSNKMRNRYLLSMDILPWVQLRSYGLNLQPHELNVILQNSGTDIFLYDTNQKIEIDASKKNGVLEKKLFYDYPWLTTTTVFKLLIRKLINR